MKFVITCLTLFALLGDVQADGPYQATGIKICEVDQTSAIIWARLTRISERLSKDHPMPIVQYKDPETGELKPRKGRPNRAPVVTFPEGSDVHAIEGAAPGMTGDVRVRYAVQGAMDWKETDWQAVDPDRDFTHQIKLVDLQPGTAYQIEVESRAGEMGQTLTGQFRTAPSVDRSERIVFHVTTGQAYGDQDSEGGGYRIYPAMLKRDPDFFVHTGDILYYDGKAKTLPLARWHWSRMFGLPTNLEFHRNVSSYFIKDDHDTWMNDCWPTRETQFMGDFTFEQGLGVFLEQVGMGESTYRTVRWGKDLQIWMVEGRDFRSPNTMPDGPDKTIWGAEQKAWFKRTVEASDAAFRVLISPTPVIGPDRERKNDNHANEGFTHEGNELRQFIAEQKNMVVVCGDRHWQYISADSATGVREYSSGPASDGHAGGWPKDKRLPEHRYLNVIGGFMEGVVEREGDKSVLIFRHFGVDGNLLNEDRFTAQ
ncbi:MAG: alkaline phosphatase D [Candidatus Latescibacterota bacterium]|jgi:alkaline phosphatase D